MNTERLPTATYRIDVEEELDAYWSAWFAPLTVTVNAQGQGTTTLTGPIADQAALRGLLNQLWNLNLTLVSVQRIEAVSTAAQLEEKLP